VFLTSWFVVHKVKFVDGQRTITLEALETLAMSPNIRIANKTLPSLDSLLAHVAWRLVTLLAHEGVVALVVLPIQIDTALATFATSLVVMKRLCSNHHPTGDL
jgi:hypothetical protein